LKKKILFTFIWLFSLITVLSAQENYFKHYNVENGLSNNSLSCSLQDHQGFLWFGTINGLNRFDGYSFKIFRHNPEDSNSIGSGFIRCLYEDRNGDLWVGTNKGIYIYHGQTEKFRLFSSPHLSEVSDIKGDNTTGVWFISNSDLFHCDQRSGKIKAYPVDTKPGTVTSIAVAPDSTVWVSTSSGMLKKYIPASDRFVTVSLLIESGNQQPEEIRKIYALRNNDLLTGTLTRGVKLFSVHNKTFQNILTVNPDKSDVFVRDCVQMTDSEYWIGTETGIYIYSVKDRSTVRLEKEYDDSYSISDNVIVSFCKDREGGLWIGTYFGGLNYFPKQFTAFQKYFPEYSKPSIHGNAVHEICQDQWGSLWVGTEDGGLNKIDLKKNRFTTFEPTGLKSSVAYHNIHGLLAIGDSLWIGTFMHGLDIMDIKTGKVIRHFDAGPGPGELKNNFIITIYQTHAGDILIGTQNGLFKFNRKQDNFSPMPEFESQIQALWEDDNRTLWACTRGNGVLYSNPLTGQKGALLFNAGDSNTLGNNYVNGIFEDSRKNLWFATDGGICKFEKEKKKFTRYTTKNGLPDNLIFRILEDEKHNLFVSTSRGLVCFNPENGDTKTYTRANGLLSDQFNYNSAYRSPDGRMFFGSYKGLISFKPGDFRKNTDVPPVYITGIEVNNREIRPDTSGSPLEESIIYAKTITLPYDQSTLNIDFAALSYTAPAMNEYAYIMEGLDKDWTFLKSKRKAYFTKLPPGNYIFKVKGANSSGVWNNQGAAIHINILPPFWQCIWAYLLYTVCIVGIAYFLIKSYLKRMVDKNTRRYELLDMEKEREIYHAKVEFFTHIAHEIRTPLTLIKMPLDKLIRKKNSNAEIYYNLKTMEKNTNRLIDLTNQLLDFRETEMDKFSLNFVKTDISDLLIETFNRFQLAAEEKDILLTMDLPRIALQAYVDPEALRKILSNLFSNAIKYAEKKVFVQLKNFSSEDCVFTVVIRNDGFIIPFSLKEKIFEPFYRIKETDKQAGNGIGLPLSRALAELHKGVLDMEKPEDGLNQFVLTIPVHQEKEFKLPEDIPQQLSSAVFTPEKEGQRNKARPDILLVEDNKEILDFVGGEISSEYGVRKALNGQEALEILQKENVQLIISDIMMPVMDGLELCKRIKTNLDYSHIPIILLTAKNSLHAKIEGLETGADAYIEKPFDFDYLSAQISNLLVNRNKIKEHFASSPLTHIKTIGYTKADKNFLEKLKVVIDENLINFDIDVEQLAKIMNMSRPTFYRKIKALSNLTPHELIHIARLKKAAEILAEGNSKVYEVAAMVGYSLQTNFARDFHKQFGMTPTDYMNDKQRDKNLLNNQS
jgi:ligand-binding sensor domain-containing protein/DNA-binding response OmpR family regulator/nitrogen-specific signal transduction histidine kinase